MSIVYYGLFDDLSVRTAHWTAVGTVEFATGGKFEDESLKESRQGILRRQLVARIPASNPRHIPPPHPFDLPPGALMKFSSTAQVSSLLALAGVCSVAEAQSRNRITVRTYRTNYRVDTWDDGRDDPYRVTFWKFGLKSVYTFDAAGHVKTLTARNTLYTFTLSVPSRKLLTSSDDDIEDSLDFDAGAEIGCSTCEVTWNTVCDVGLREVCFLDAIKPAAFDEDGIDSVRRFCTSFGESCKTSASELCAGQCTGEIYT